jgi:hypothetical protein
MTRTEKQFYAAVFELLDEVKRVCGDDQYLISMMLQSALSQHLHDCMDQQMTENAMTFLGESINNLLHKTDVQMTQCEVEKPSLTVH